MDRSEQKSRRRRKKKREREALKKLLTKGTHKHIGRNGEVCGAEHPVSAEHNKRSTQNAHIQTVMYGINSAVRQLVVFGKKGRSLYGRLIGAR